MDASTATRTDPRADAFWRRLRAAALWSVALGLALEGVALALESGLLVRPPAARIAADVAQKVTWSGLVCVGIVAGSAATRARALAMSFLGFVSGPLAFAVARAVHKALLQALAVSAPAAGVLTPLEVAGIKAVEYAVFGWCVGRLARGSQARFSHHLWVGLSIGFVFGGLLLGWTIARASTPPSTAELVARGINELLFPIGCAAVVYITERVIASGRG